MKGIWKSIKDAFSIEPNIVSTPQLFEKSYDYGVDNTRVNNYNYIDNSVSNMAEFSSIVSEMSQISKRYYYARTIRPVKSAISKIATCCASINFHLKMIIAGEDQIINDMPINELLDSPNNKLQKTLIEFVRKTVYEYYINGCWYWVLDTGLTSNVKGYRFTCLQADQISKSNNDYMLNLGNAMGAPMTRFKYNIKKDAYIDETGRYMLYVYEDYSSGVDISSLSKLTSIALEMKQFIEASIANAVVFKNGAGGGIMNFQEDKDGLSGYKNEQEIMEFEERMQKKFRGATNNNKLHAIASKLAVQYMPIGGSPKDMMYNETVRERERDIYKGLDIPLPLMDDSKSTYNNMQEATFNFYTNTVIPLMDKIIDHWERFLFPVYGMERRKNNGYYFEIDRSSIRALLDDQLKYIEKTEGILTVNERRIAIGKESLGPAGDVISVNGQMQPINSSRVVNLIDRESDEEYEPALIGNSDSEMKNATESLLYNVNRIWNTIE